MKKVKRGDIVEQIWCEEDDELVGLEFELSFFRRCCPSLITPPVGLKIGEFGKLVGKKKKVGYTGSALKYWMYKGLGFSHGTGQWWWELI